MFRLIGFGLAIATLIFGFITARRFVRERLRYVDAVQGRRAALLAGVGAAVLSALPFAFVPLPVFGLAKRWLWICGTWICKAVSSRSGTQSSGSPASSRSRTRHVQPSRTM